MARYAISLWAAPFWATLAVNASGGLLMGLLAAALPDRAPSILWLLLGAGFLGGFTTFSAFSLDAMRLIGDGRPGLFILYAGGSVLLAVGGVAVGLYLGQMLL